MAKHLELSISPIDLPGAPPEACQGHILVAEAWNATPHLETGLEIAVRLATRGYKVDYMHYGSVVSSVEYYNHLGTSFKAKALGYSKPPQQKGIRILKALIKERGLNIRIINPPDCRRLAQGEACTKWPNTVEDLKKLTWRSSNNIGISVASSLVTLSSNSLVTPAEHSDLCDNLFCSYIEAYLSISRVISKSAYSALVVFNGRFPCIKGAVAAAADSRVCVFYHERGCASSHFSLTSYQPHNRELLQADIRKSWLEVDKHLAAVIADSYFKGKRSGVDKAWVSFTAEQKPGLASEFFREIKYASPGSKVAVYFSSSDDEYASTDDVYFPLVGFNWRNQREALAVLAQATLLSDTSLIVRVHPRQEQMASADREAWNTLSFLDSCLKKHIHIIPSSSQVSTYELIDFADVAVTSGSTVGIEASYWGKPSILLAQSLYSNLFSNPYRPRSVAEIASLLSRLDELSVEREASLAYGYYMATFGIEYQLYKPNGLFNGEFIGEDLDYYSPTFRHRASRILKNLLGFNQFHSN